MISFSIRPVRAGPFSPTVSPRCGDSFWSDLSRISIPFLVRTAEALFDRLGITTSHLIGHFMDGLTSLLLAQKHPDRVCSLVDIEGNLVPRQIVTTTNDPEVFLDRFIERTKHAPAYPNALYAISLRQKVRAGAVRGIFPSMVQLSDGEDLMGISLGLLFPRMFMYGELNNGLFYLSYLSTLQAEGVQLAEIPWCGHFPMYSNPPEMYRHIGGVWESIE